MNKTDGRRAIVIVLDGCGAGAAPDAADFGDGHGPSTVKHVWEKVGRFTAPSLESIGFLAACGIGSAASSRFGRLQELSRGKDSVTGHWEMMGIETKVPFPTYPDGFPPKVIKQFERAIGRQTIGNVAASGTEIIQRLGPLHVKTGMPIVYTSADSVFQIACHQDVVPVPELYEICRTARSQLITPNNVERVIARPFIGSEKEGYTRTEHRKDFPLDPPSNLIDDIGDVFGIGVVPELFNGRGFRTVRRTQCNEEHAEMLEEALASDARFIFANFEDTDMKYGHRSNPVGFAKCLEDFDKTLAHVLDELRERDLLLLTADHGNDPTDESTDHTREYVPVAIAGRSVVPKQLGDAVGMACVGATVAAHLGADWKYETGRSLLG